MLRLSKREIWIAILAFLVLWLVSPTLLPSFDAETNGGLFNSDQYVGCHTRNALIGYVECRGFPGSEVIKVFLTIPLLILTVILIIPFGIMQSLNLI